MEQSEILKSLPHKGSWHYAQNQKFKETIVFVHYFGGSPKSMRRHVQMVNEMGYNAVTFQLVFNELKFPVSLPISSKMEFGIFSIWRDQIESILNAVSGPKIVYSFSNPCVSSLYAISDRNGSDVSACICDSGPAKNILKSWWNLLAENYKIKSTLLRVAMLPVGYFFTGTSLVEHFQKTAAALPAGFAILSIRGWKDPLIPYEEIEAFFDQFDRADLKVLSLTKGAHLDGLKNFAEEYVPQVKEFLQKHSQQI